MTPKNVVKEIQSMDLAKLTILSRNLGLFIKGLLEEKHISIHDISEEFNEWLESLSSHEVLNVQIGILYRLEQEIVNKEMAIKDGKPFDLESHEYYVSNGCTRLTNLKTRFRGTKNDRL